MAAEERRIVADAVAALKVKPAEIPDRVASLQKDVKQLTRQVSELKSSVAVRKSGDLSDSVMNVDGIKVLALELEDQTREGLRNQVDTLKQKLGSGVVVLGAVVDGEKVALTVGVSKDLTDRLQAGKIVGRLARICGGGGGGRPDLAEAGGKDPEKLPDAIKAVPEVIRELLG